MARQETFQIMARINLFIIEVALSEAFGSFTNKILSLYPHQMEESTIRNHDMTPFLQRNMHKDEKGV